MKETVGTYVFPGNDQYPSGNHEGKIQLLRQDYSFWWRPKKSVYAYEVSFENPPQWDGKWGNDGTYVTYYPFKTLGIPDREHRTDLSCVAMAKYHHEVMIKRGLSKK